jgi:hypothetical protein
MKTGMALASKKPAWMSWVAQAPVLPLVPAHKRPLEHGDQLVKRLGRIRPGPPDREGVPLHALVSAAAQLLAVVHRAHGESGDEPDAGGGKNGEEQAFPIHEGFGQSGEHVHRGLKS